MQLAGAHVLVTGASRGIGAHIAARAAGRGAAVTLVARSADPLHELAARIGGHAVPVDLADPLQRSGLIQRVEGGRAGRPVDVLVNAAGTDAVGSVLATSERAMQGLFQVNLLAPTELCRQVVPGMVARGRGRIVNVSSGFSAVVTAGLASYCSSKAGLSHFTAALRQELTGTGVGTTLVELGPVRTQMIAAILEDRLTGPALRRLLRLDAAPMVEPDDVAKQVCEAVERGRAHVVLPKRLTPVVALTWLPRRAADVLLGGLPKR